MVSWHDWITKSFLFFHSYRKNYTSIDFVIQNETEGLSYVQEGGSYKIFHIIKANGDYLLNSGGKNKQYINIYDLIKLGQSNIIRVTASKGSLKVEGFLKDYKPQIGITNWKLLGAPKQLSDEQYLMWHETKPSIYIDKEARALRKRYGLSDFYSYTNVTSLHLEENIYAQLIERSYGVFGLEIYFHNWGYNEEYIFELVHEEFKPIDQIESKYYPTLQEVIRGKQNIGENWEKYLTEGWDHPYFVQLRPIHLFFKGIAQYQKKLLKNYLRRIKRWVNPLFETIQTTFWRIWLIKLGQVVQVFDSFIKMFIGFRIQHAKAFEAVFLPLLNFWLRKIMNTRWNRREGGRFLRSLFRPLEHLRKRLIAGKLGYIFSPLKQLCQNSDLRDKMIYKTLKPTCSYPNCNLPIHFGNLFHSTDAIRKMIYQYYYNRKFDPSTPPLEFVCCTCIHKLTRDTNRRKRMMKALEKTFRNFVFWLKGIEQIYLESQIIEIPA